MGASFQNQIRRILSPSKESHQQPSPGRRERSCGWGGAEATRGLIRAFVPAEPNEPLIEAASDAVIREAAARRAPTCLLGK